MNKPQVADMSDQDNTSMKHAAFNFEMKRINDSDEEGTIEGIASTFGGNPDSDGDVIERGAFAKSLLERGPNAKQNVRFLWQHDRTRPIGAVRMLQETDVGLAFKNKITTGSTDGKNAYELIKDGAVDQISIGFIPVEQTYNSETGINTIHEARLFEISVVTFPANSDAVITGVKSTRDWEGIFKREGLSNNESKVAAKALTEVLNLRDAGEVSKDGFWDSDGVRDALRKANESFSTAVKEDGGTLGLLQSALTKSNA